MKNHLKRIASPRTWRIERKRSYWITKPLSGPHTLERAISLNTFLKEFLKITKTSRESKKVLVAGKVLVNAVTRKDLKFPVGFLDVVSLPLLQKHFRIILNKKNILDFLEIDKEEAQLKPSKIIGKTTLKKKKIQLNLDDGQNRRTEKNEYHVNDTLLINTQSKEIVHHFKLEKGSTVFLTGGSHVGEIGKIEDIQKLGVSGSKLIFSKEHKKFITHLKYAYVIGKEKPSITLTK